MVSVLPAPAPSLVVAGAGSGKTETMAARVVYLVANGQVRADEVLGLTFTRKAAAQLSQRIRKRVTMVDAIVPVGTGKAGGPGFGDPNSARGGTSAGTSGADGDPEAVSYTHLRAHETDSYLVCRLLLEKKK